MSPKTEPQMGLTEDEILEHAAKIVGARKAQRAAEVAVIKKEARENGQARRARANTRFATGVPWFDELTDEEQMRAIAEANLKEYGSIVPPPEARLQPLSKECVSCHKVKPVVRDFGVRFYKGVPQSQSHCKQCRKEADLHKRNPYYVSGR